MGRNVLDHIPWTICLKIGWLCLDILENIFYIALSTSDKGWRSFIWIT